MDIAIVFDWLAQDSVLAAELAADPMQREIWHRLALMWAVAAQQSDKASTNAASSHKFASNSALQRRSL
jgi:hypothetical protein